LVIGGAEDETGARWLRVVLLTPIARELIGAETTSASPAETVPARPDAVTAGAATLVLIRYDDWKARVRSRQTPKGDNPNG